MQRFRDKEHSAGTPRYDSETVRRVLVRASDIEQQQAAENQSLTATQIETLGSEIGLSPVAIRQALGEVRPYRATTTKVDHSPKIWEFVSVPLPGLAYGAVLTALHGFCVPRIFSVAPSPAIELLLFSAVLVVPPLLSLLIGWCRGDRRLSVATSFFLTFFAAIAPKISLSLKGHIFGNYTTSMEIILLGLSVLNGVLLGWVGAWLRQQAEQKQ